MTTLRIRTNTSRIRDVRRYRSPATKRSTAISQAIGDPLDGLETGYEVVGDDGRQGASHAMLEASMIGVSQAGVLAGTASEVGRDVAIAFIAVLIIGVLLTLVFWLMRRSQAQPSISEIRRAAADDLAAMRRSDGSIPRNAPGNNPDDL